MKIAFVIVALLAFFAVTLSAAGAAMKRTDIEPQAADELGEWAENLGATMLLAAAILALGLFTYWRSQA